jgi:hypothetical protein
MGKGDERPKPSQRGHMSGLSRQARQDEAIMAAVLASGGSGFRSDHLVQARLAMVALHPRMFKSPADVVERINSLACRSSIRREYRDLVHRLKPQ